MSQNSQTHSFPSGGGPVTIIANATVRYEVVCRQPGTKIQFVVLAGQSFTIDGAGGTVDVSIVDAALDGAQGIRLVDAPPE